MNKSNFTCRRLESSAIYKKLPRSFYLRSTIIVAKDILGKYLIRKFRGKFLIGKIIEVEAYLNKNDPASHSFNGKTKRNEVMFWEGGHLYVYFTYGMHFCCNVVTEEEGKGCAVLIRAVEPICDLRTISKLRNIEIQNNPYNLTNGPAKLCEAFVITKTDNGTDLCGNEIWIGEIELKKFRISNLESRKSNKIKIATSTRIGITNGKEHKWRFYIKDNPWVSKENKKFKIKY